MERPTILLVDDDPIQRRLSRLCLTDAGFDVETATNADEALRSAHRRRPAAILSDVVMDDVDGFALCRRVRGERELDGVPVILVSAHFDDRADQTLAAHVGASALVARTPDLHFAIEALASSLRGGAVPAGPAPTDRQVYEEHLRSVTRQLSQVVASARSSEAHYLALLDAATDVIAVTDARGLIIEANRRWEQLLERPYSSLVGSNLWELWAEDDPAGAAARYAEAVAQGKGEHRAVRVRRPDGSVVVMDIAINVLTVEGHRLVLSIGHDVTEKLAAARALQASEARYRELIERLPDVVWSSDPDGTLHFISTSIARLTGYAREEIAAQGPAFWYERIHPEDRERVVRLSAEQRAAGNTSLDIEYRWRHRDGRWRWFHSRAIARSDASGMRLEGILSDNSERRLLEESLRQAQKMEAIGCLAGGVAHDFNNLLTVIIASAGFVSMELAPDDPRRADMEQLELAAERAAALTRQLLMFSSKAVRQPQDLAPDVVLKDLARMLQRLIGEDITFTIKAPALRHKVRIDRGELEQVVMNLVVNARDAMPRGGALTIDVGEVVAGGAPRVRIAVTDSGCGIDPEVQARIFEPFFTTKEAGKGTGLGLSTVYGIVTGAGGTIAVTSEVGRGTTFEVLLPVPETAAAAAAGTAAAAAATARASERVLLVEDEHAVRALSARVLRSAGYTVIEARNGEDALGLLDGGLSNIDLVLTDIVMPTTSGIDLVEAVRGRMPTARVIFMSGYSDHPALRQALDAEAALFISKPFTPRALLDKVAEALR